MNFANIKKRPVKSHSTEIFVKSINKYYKLCVSLRTETYFYVERIIGSERREKKVHVVIFFVVISIFCDCLVNNN